MLRLRFTPNCGSWTDVIDLDSIRAIHFFEDVQKDSGRFYLTE